MTLNSKNWLEEMFKVYDQPNRILFRGVELKTIVQSLVDLDIKSPVLDLGCGEGRIAKALFGEIIEVGLDNTLEEIKQAKAEGIYNLSIMGDALNLPFGEQEFNLVFSNCVVEHIQDNVTVLQEVYRVLKPQGLFVFTVPSDNFGDYLYFYNLFKKMGFVGAANRYKNFRNKTLNHYHCYSPHEWERRLQRVGLKLIKHQYYLSKEALKSWDLFAFESLIMRKCSLGHDSLFKIVKKLKSDKWRREMEDYYDYICSQDGAALLVVAQK